MKYRFCSAALRTKHPFGISRGRRQTFPLALLKISLRGQTGFGEAAPSSYYGGENLKSVRAFWKRLDTLALADNFDAPSAVAPLLRATTFDGAAKAAVDMALYDLYGKIHRMPVYACLHLPAPAPKATSFTIGLGPFEEMERKVLEARRYPILKVKIGTPRDEENLRLVRSLHKGKIRVDANAAWTPEEAVRCLERLARFDLEFVEQPIEPRHGHEGWRFVKARSPFPLLADESARVPSDLTALEGAVDGVNIKLMKCGGISEGLKMAREAKRRGLRVMLGCMIETSLAITAAFHLSSLADWLDLDGHLLIKKDLFRGVREKTPGVLTLPRKRAGLGVTPVMPDVFALRRGMGQNRKYLRRRNRRLA